MIGDRTVPRFRDGQDQGGACVEVPDFGRVYLVPVIDFRVLQQKVDARAAWPACVFSHPGFAVMAAFGVGFQAQGFDDLLRSHGNNVPCWHLAGKA